MLSMDCLKSVSSEIEHGKCVCVCGIFCLCLICVCVCRFLGYGAGLNSSGDGNVFIGNLAGDNASGGNKLYINNKSSSFPLIYGEFNNQLLRINGSLNINGDYTLPTISGSTGAIAIAGGSGNTLNWSPYYFPSTSGTAGQTLILNNVGYS